MPLATRFKYLMFFLPLRFPSHSEQTDHPRALLPYRVQDVLQQALTLRDRHAAGVVSDHGPSNSLGLALYAAERRAQSALSVPVSELRETCITNYGTPSYDWHGESHTTDASRPCVARATVRLPSLTGPTRPLDCPSHREPVDLEPAGGTYIYSSAEAYSEEQRIDHERPAWLDWFGLQRVGGLPGSEEGPFHASGHLDGPGMERLIETIAPERIVPVHTQRLWCFEERWGEKVVPVGYAEPLVLG